MINTANCMNDNTTKEQFAASFIQILKRGTRIATGKVRTAGNARDFIRKVRAGIERENGGAW